MKKTIALIAHDHKKDDLLRWVTQHSHILTQYHLCATGTTGKLIAQRTDLKITRYQSGPLGGDAKIGSLIAEGEIDVMIFFFDPLASLPHDPDVKALLRLAAVWNIPVATNEATADLIINADDLSSYIPRRPNYDNYTSRMDL